MDAYTELKSIEAGNMGIKYSFLITDDPTQQTGFSVKDDNFTQQVETVVKTSACQNKNTRRYINSNVSLSYRYINTENISIADFVIPAGFCNK